MGKRPTSRCCCIGVRCKCPKGKICPSKKNDKSNLKSPKSPKRSKKSKSPKKSKL